MKRSLNENTPLTVLLTVLAVFALASAAPAGIVDSPLPGGIYEARVLGAGSDQDWRDQYFLFMHKR